jgi:hypothetical protein
MIGSRATRASTSRLRQTHRAFLRVATRTAPERPDDLVQDGRGKSGGGTYVDTDGAQEK